MEKIMWDDRYKMGVEAVDRAHAKLFRIVNKLFDLSQDASANQAAYKEGIKYLEAYSMTHFSEEEAYMRSIRYGGYAEHKRIHDNFRNKTLISLKKDLELSGYSSSAVERFVGIMGNWLTEHIMLEDQAIVGKAVRQKKKDLSTQIEIISKAGQYRIQRTEHRKRVLLLPVLSYGRRGCASASSGGRRRSVSQRNRADSGNPEKRDDRAGRSACLWAAF